MLTEYFHIQLSPATELLLPLDYTTGVVTLTLEQICPIPGVAPNLLGVANQGGRLLWVLDLSDLLGLVSSVRKTHAKTNLTLVVLNGSDRAAREQDLRQVGCVVSLLKGIVSLDPEQIQPLPGEFPPALKLYGTGVARIEQPVTVLNVNAIFTALSTCDRTSVHP
jgi:twitching motility protein PilI